MKICDPIGSHGVQWVPGGQLENLDDKSCGMSVKWGLVSNM